jgi:hypothetical protein
MMTRWHIGLVFGLLAAAGCGSVAGSVAGGTAVAYGSHLFHNSCEETVLLPLADARRAAREALRDLRVDVLGVKPKGEGAACTGVDIEGCLLGEELIAVDVVLERLGSRMTRVEVRAGRGWHRPEPELAGAVLKQIVDRAAARGPVPRG